MHDPFDPILNEEQYTALVGISRPTAQRQRSDGSGPPFVQLSERRIGYRQSAVEQWLEKRTINRVGELVSAKQAPDPTAQATITAAVTPAVTKASPKRHQLRGTNARPAFADLGSRSWKICPPQPRNHPRAAGIGA